MKVVYKKSYAVAALLLLPLIVVMVCALPAEATVAVAPTTAAAGSTIDAVFTVSSDTDITTQVQVYFSPGHLPASVGAPSKSGWSINIDQSTGKVASIAWTGGSIAKGQSDTFPVTIELPGDTPVLLTAIVQTYADGSSTKWVDDPAATASTSVHPSPLITLTGSVAATTTTTVKGVSSTTVAPAASKAKAKHKSSVGISLIGIGLCCAVIVLSRMRQRLRNKED